MGRTRTWRRTRWAIAAVAAAGLAAGCSSSGTSVGGSSTSAGADARSSSSTITVQMYPGNSTSWMTYIAQQEGFFKDAGLNVELTSLTTGTTGTAALIGGSIDIGLVDLFNTGPLLVQNAQLSEIVQQLTIGQQLIAAPGVPQKTLAQTFPLKPGTVVGAASVAGATAYEVRYLQQAFGGKQSDVKVVADITAAGLDKDREPYVYANPNVVCTMVAKGATVVGSLAKSDPSYPAAVNVLAGLPDNGYWAMNSWISSHKTQAEAFQQAIVKATQWAKSHVSAATAILRKSSGFNIPSLSSSQFSSCVQGIAPTWTTTLTQAEVNNWQKVLQSVGDIPQAATLPPVAKWTFKGALTG